MSKGNMLQGRARGSVGDVTFQVLKGQQIAKARNRMPANPRTTKQMAQRSLFIDAVKFYTRGTQNLFKFAFEGKKATESEFNAFMRINAKLGVNISPDAFKDFTYPALGRWVMSQGSLAVNSSPYWSDTLTAWVFGSLTSESSMGNTVGSASKVIMASSNAMIGDIVTTVIIIANGSTVENTPDVYPEQRGPVSWNISQFRIDPNSNEPLPASHKIAAVGNDYQLEVEPEVTSDVAGFALVLSRNTSAGLKVSTSFLIPNTAAEDALIAAEDETYVGQVLSAWQASGNAILQGSLSE